MLVYASLPSSMDRCTLVVMPNGAFLIGGKGGKGAKSEMSKLGKFGRKRVECSWLNQVGGRKKGRGEDRVSEARIEVGCYGERVEGRMKGRRARD